MEKSLNTAPDIEFHHWQARDFYWRAGIAICFSEKQFASDLVHTNVYRVTLDSPSRHFFDALHRLLNQFLQYLDIDVFKLVDIEARLARFVLAQTR